MKYLLSFFVAVVVSIFLVSSIFASNLASDFGLESEMKDLEKTCQAYLNSGDYEKAEETIAIKYATATTRIEKDALVAAYADIKKIKEFAEVWTIPLEDVATITKTEEDGVITYHFDFHKNKK
jgi:predicted RND superfamily exporter protein